MSSVADGNRRPRGNDRLSGFLFSFQTKLVLAFTFVMLLAIFFAGVAFVVQNRDERRQAALDRVAAVSPTVYQQALYTLVESGPEGTSLAQVLDEIGQEQDVRILVVAVDGTVLHDTRGGLVGQVLAYPGASRRDFERGFIAWEPQTGFPERDLTFVAAPQRLSFGRSEIPFSIVLAVESDTVTGAWLGVLPSLIFAALIAIPLASLAAIGLARQVARPVMKLTEASEAIARGDFDQHVEAERDDEIGRLAAAFSSMAERVGERDAQMRALLANVSHDLKTPMTSITGYAQALTDGTADGDDASRIGAVIHEEAAHVNQLLADLLYLGEIDAGQVLSKSEDVVLATLVARCARRIEPVVEPKGVELVIDVAPDVVLTGVDTDKMDRALTNVLENAAKFTPGGGTIRVAGAMHDGGTVRVAVHNTGSAIDAEDLPRIFDRFFRGDRARRVTGGSGLGLAIARELVELQGGTISAYSDAEGVTFELRLRGEIAASAGEQSPAA